MRISLLLALLVSTVGCGGSADVRLPRLGTVGDPPPPSETLEITVHSDGAVWVEDRKLDRPALLDLLETRTRDYPRDDRYTNLRSRLNVCVRCDDGAALSDLIPVLHACLDPAVRITRLFYAARHEDGGEGAFAWFLPHDCGCNHPGDAPRFIPTVRVELAAGAPVDAGALYSGLCALPEERRSCAEISADADVRVGELLRAADICLRAGASVIVLIVGFRAPGGKDGIRLDGELVSAIGEHVPCPPPVARVRGLAGFSQDVRVLWEDVIVDVAKERDEDDLPVEEMLGR